MLTDQLDVTVDNAIDDVKPLQNGRDLFQLRGIQHIHISSEHGKGKDIPVSCGPRQAAASRTPSSLLGYALRV